MASIIDDVADMLADTLVATPGYNNLTGDFVPSGEVLSLPCHISGFGGLVRTEGGHEVVSSYMVTVGATPGLTADAHRYTLPARYSPRSNLKAIRVKPVSDESGAHHEVVYLP